MADNITVPGTGEALAFDEIGGIKHQRVKMQHGADGSATDVSSASPLPVSNASLPLPTGAATSANQASEQTLTGAVTETAPASDTASSGLNGRLQRIAQRLTSLIAQIPAALGQATMANSLAVTIASNQSAVPVSGTVTVNALPAGTANIGDVDVLTLPAIPAGTNNIGDVDVLTEPATAADNAASLPAVVKVMAGWDGTNVQAVKTDSDGNLQVEFGSAQSVTISGGIETAPSTSGGLLASRLISAASTNATSVKASAGQVYGGLAYNLNAAVRYLKVYNKASAPTVGTDTPVLTIPIPPTSGVLIPGERHGVAFATGIAFALTTGYADNDTASVGAGDCIINLLYK